MFRDSRTGVVGIDEGDERRGRDGHLFEFGDSNFRMPRPVAARFLDEPEADDVFEQRTDLP